MGKSKDLATGSSTLYQTQTTSDTRYVNTAGDTMTGNLLLGDNKIGVGIASPTAHIHIESADDTEFMNFTQTGNEKWAFRDSNCQHLPFKGNDLNNQVLILINLQIHEIKVSSKKFTFRNFLPLCSL